MVSRKKKRIALNIVFIGGYDSYPHQPLMLFWGPNLSRVKEFKNTCSLTLSYTTWKMYTYMRGCTKVLQVSHACTISGQKCQRFQDFQHSIWEICHPLEMSVIRPYVNILRSGFLQTSLLLDILGFLKTTLGP